ncbi:conserved domain protein [Peptoniphilus sp. oral taxon 375 str. F0436]|nr:conserved domain protein [Peptoniphilus sp. oral taxon 375 str. F0436]
MTKQIESWLEPVKKDPEAFSWFRKQVEDKKEVLEDLLEDLAYTKTIHRYYAKRKSKERFVSNAKTRKYALDEILLRDQIKEFKDIDPIHFLAYGEVFSKRTKRLGIPTWS